MATQLKLLNTTTNGITDTGDGIVYDLSTSFGAAADTLVVNTAASGTEIQWTDTAGGATVAFISGRTPAGGFTLTTTDVSAWCHESNMNANIGGRYRVFKRTAAGTVSELGGGPFNDGVEFGTAATEMLWVGNVTDTAFAEDDRILVRFYITNVGTMGGGFTGTLTFNAAAATTGDSFFNIAETVAFKANAPTLVIQDATHSHTADNVVLSIPLDVGNTYEGGTDGVTITTANSGGDSGDAFDVVTIAASSALTFDNDHPASGTLGEKSVFAASGAIYTEYRATIGTQSEIYGRRYFWADADPPSTVPFIGMLSGAGSTRSIIAITAPGLIELGDSAGGIGNLQFSGVDVEIPLGEQLRLEWHVVFHASAGVVEGKLFSGHGTTPIAERSFTARNTGGVADWYRTGVFNIGTITWTYWADDPRWATDGWIGPSGSAPTNLVIQDAVHAHAADNLALTQASSLVVADGRSLHTADDLSLTQVHNLTIADARSLHAADNLALAQVHLLQVLDALHAHSADNVVLAIELFKVQNLVATGVSGTQVDLTWNDVVELTGEGYDIERDGVVIVWFHGTNSYSDTGLDPSTTYTYRVRASETV